MTKAVVPQSVMITSVWMRHAFPILMTIIMLPCMCGCVGGCVGGVVV